MKTEQGENNFGRRLHNLFRRRRRGHDRMLLLNLSVFNFTGGWRRTFANSEYARAWAR